MAACVQLDVLLVRYLVYQVVYSKYKQVRPNAIVATNTYI